MRASFILLFACLISACGSNPLDELPESQRSETCEIAPGVYGSSTTECNVYTALEERLKNRARNVGQVRDPRLQGVWVLADPSDPTSFYIGVLKVCNSPNPDQDCRCKGDYNDVKILATEVYAKDPSGDGYTYHPEAWEKITCWPYWMLGLSDHTPSEYMNALQIIYKATDDEDPRFNKSYHLDFAYWSAQDGVIHMIGDDMQEWEGTYQTTVAIPKDFSGLDYDIYQLRIQMLTQAICPNNQCYYLGVNL